MRHEGEGDGVDARGGIPMAGERRMGSHWRGEKKGVKKCRSRGNGRKKSGRLYGGGAGVCKERGGRRMERARAEGDGREELVEVGEQKKDSGRA